MRVILLSLILSVFIYADEMQRIESIVNDITKLRTDYEECKTELKSQETKKTAPKVFIDKTKEITCKNEKNQIKKLKNILISKDKEILNLKKEINNFKSIIIKKFDNSNKFPKLMMKPEYQKDSKKIEKFKAKSFHLKKDSYIYDARDGRKLDKWYKNTTFTSNIKHGRWIKITGYFVDKKWRKAQKELWIKQNHIVQK